MEAFLDIIWFKILDGILYVKDVADRIFEPLNALGPAGAILVIALITVMITKGFSSKIKTRRYRTLKKQYLYWFQLRQEASQSEDREKGDLLAKNIDSAKLNKVYWDFFLEGFLLSMATCYLPMLIMAAYINEAYMPERLQQLIGQDYLFTLAAGLSEPILVGAIFWYVISLVIIYSVWFGIKKTISRYFSTNAPVAARTATD